MTGETQRTLQPEDLFRFQFLQDARLSPSGNYIAYCISHVDAAKDAEFCAIWLLSPQTGEARQLTDGPPSTATLSGRPTNARLPSSLPAVA